MKATLKVKIIAAPATNPEQVCSTCMHTFMHQEVLTYRHRLQLVIQDIQLSVSHGGSNGAGGYPLKVTPITAPAACPDGGFCWTIDIVDLCVWQHLTRPLSYTPTQDRQ